MDDSPDGKQAGTMIWGGLPNLIWVSHVTPLSFVVQANGPQWVDRKTGLCGLYAGQVLPTGDAKCAALNRKFEEAMYKQCAKSGAVGTLKL